MLDSVKGFSVSAEMIFIFFACLGNELIDFQMLNQPYIAGMNQIWVWYLIFIYFYGIQIVNILLRIFPSMFMKDTCFFQKIC